LAIQTSALGFRLSPVRCVTDDPQGFSLRLFVGNGARFCFVSRTTKYSVEDLVSAAATVTPRTATPVAIRIAFILFHGREMSRRRQRGEIFGGSTSPVRPTAILVTSAPRPTSLLQQRHRNILENGVRTVEPDGVGSLDFDAAKTFQTFQPQQFARHFGQPPLLDR
jgi:hypothetical protein